jgi:hypothetical protein
MGTLKLALNSGKATIGCTWDAVDIPCQLVQVWEGAFPILPPSQDIAHFHILGFCRHLKIFIELTFALGRWRDVAPLVSTQEIEFGGRNEINTHRQRRVDPDLPQ